jgi:hypothetical protein
MRAILADPVLKEALYKQKRKSRDPEKEKARVKRWLANPANRARVREKDRLRQAKRFEARNAAMVAQGLPLPVMNRIKCKTCAKILSKEDVMMTSKDYPQCHRCQLPLALAA